MGFLFSLSVESFLVRGVFLYLRLIVQKGEFFDSLIANFDAFAFPKVDYLITWASF